jgi:hypothetical protein
MKLVPFSDVTMQCLCSSFWRLSSNSWRHSVSLRSISAIVASSAISDFLLPVESSTSMGAGVVGRIDMVESPTGTATPRETGVLQNETERHSKEAEAGSFDRHPA